jgi:hypothetical protein
MIAGERVLWLYFQQNYILFKYTTTYLITMSNAIYKYPRTYHLEGSGIESVSKESNKIPFSAITNRYLVVEEKNDLTINADIQFIWSI